MQSFVPVLIPAIAGIPMILFWFRMFKEMMADPYLSDSSRYYWTLAFIFFNVFAAVAYYVLEYRDRT